MDEILVHVTAPSSVRDDARYRAQVAAILNFQSARHPISGTAHSHTDPGDHHSHQVSAVGSPFSQHEASPLREASRPAWETFPDRLDSEANDLQNPDDHIDLDSLESLVSVIPDSQEIVAPAPDPVPDPEPVGSGPAFAVCYPPSKRRCIQPQSLKTLAHSPAAESDITRPASATDQPDVDIHPIHPVQHVIGDALNPICISSSIESIGESTDSSLPTPVPNPEPLALASTATAPAPSTTAPTFPLPPVLNLTFPLEIHAPQPPISTAPFTTHITSTLSMLKDRLRPERTYKPTHQTRDLDPLERGYWFIKFNIGSNEKKGDQSWSTSSFQTFWAFLKDFIAKDGRAGWGVWCILERSPLSSEVGSTSPSKSTLTETIDVSVSVSLKVYAWGEIAMHIYLLLFLASERRIRGMGVQWRDAGETAVIQMP
ncbi:hypothetical protein PENANT_c003G09325 [Penicillium antarcticum]|uniref:Uncharacterized protein n=1 Tax=Penicillium antarcticum TaxID=416450 RepID=A0A1V6QHN1_9EURO|nr:uncharacterized protein N7508_005935 [Penicillium antarcticum]KAJ5306920.1 hypothetical protein N7508_005935 [Penicillium antarcticum]OQD88731.1 hypothetical protein PENANT_c003G09325 [Penicillium antarcticum]